MVESESELEEKKGKLKEYTEQFYIDNCSIEVVLRLK